MKAIEKASYTQKNRRGVENCFGELKLVNNSCGIVLGIPVLGTPGKGRGFRVTISQAQKELQNLPESVNKEP